VQYPLLKGFNFSYSQTSLWDFSDSNDPFFYDSSYRPEFFYYLENLPGLRLPPSCQAGLQAGIGHESNGQKDPDHRSLNILYIRPILTLSATRGDLFLIVAPKAYVYIGGLPLNPDMPKYRGYCDLRVVFGQRDGLELATIGRLGSDFDKGSLQFDLTYPLTKILGGNVDIAVDAQYFIGYGDTLLTYNQYSQIFRVGLALVR
jgi:phospholipase A1